METMENEALIRLSCFAAVLVAMLLWEWRAPRRANPPPWRRWGANAGLLLTSTLVLRLALPMLAMGMAEFAAAHTLGVLNWAHAPLWLALPVALVVLDCAIYWQHRLMHTVPWLWRLHRVHHSDVALDASSALRFHPLEIMLSMLFKMALVLALGAPPLAVLVFEILLNASALFNHGNVRLPRDVDRVMRKIFVTPDMHRVHHSVNPHETNRNFGFNLAVWDHCFGSYCAAPALGHTKMTLGLEHWRAPPQQTLFALLLNPFERTRKRDH